MSEHLSAQMVKSYCQRLLSPAELLEAHDHITVCEICRQRLLKTEQVAAEASRRITINNLVESIPEHPEFEDFAAYVDDKLDGPDREILRSHIELCPNCAEELRDLLGFKAALANVPHEPTALETAASPKTYLLRRWRLFKLFSQPRLAGAFAVTFVFIASVIWIALRSDSTHEIITSVPTVPAAEITDSQVLHLLPQTQSPKKEISVVLKDGGGKVSIDAAGNIVGLESLPAVYQATVRTALRKQATEPSRAVADLIGRSEVLMGGPETNLTFSVNTPVGTVVSSDRPMFRWDSLAGATSYTVQVFDSDFKNVATSPQLSTPEWKIEKSLKSGEIYSWQVTAVTAEGVEVTSPTSPAPEARFRILEQDKANNLRRARQNYGRSHLTMGVLYSREGLMEDAEREFRALLRDNPRSSLVRKLLREVTAARRKR